MATTIVLAEGDLLPEIEIQFTDATGAAVNLTTSTGQTITARKLFGTGTPLLDAAAMTVVDAAQGKAKYTPQSGDTAVPGVYRVRCVATFPTAKPVSAPNGKPLVMVVNRKV